MEDTIKLKPQEKTIQIYKQNDKNPILFSKYLPLTKPEEIKKPLLSTFDTLICLIVLSPCVLGVWRGTWVLLEIYVKYIPSWICFWLGVAAYLIFVIFQDDFNNIVTAKKIPKIYILCLTRFYTYIFAVSSVMYWRGGWAYIDSLLRVQLSPKGLVQKKNSELLLMVSGISLVLIIILRSLRNCIAPPFVFSTDRKNKTFIIPTRFKTKMREKASLYILDCLFSVLIIGTLVVFVWRGAWALVDIYLFPDNEVWSAWGSLIVGYSAVAIAFMLQPFMRWLCDRITGVSRLLVADLFLILSLIGTVNAWRGIWNLLNLYLLPDNLELSCWITHCFCLLILILLGCSNSLLVRGVYIDAEEPAGKCVVFPCYYLRLIFQEQKLKKIQKEQNKSEMTNVKTVKTCENNHVTQTIAINHKEADV